jgi:hypothetical protein
LGNRQILTADYADLTDGGRGATFAILNPQPSILASHPIREIRVIRGVPLTELDEKCSPLIANFRLILVRSMFPRTALVIAALLIASIVAFFVRGAFLGERGETVRNIAVPYEKLVARMRQLAEAGRTDELRALIIKADEHRADVSHVCLAPQKQDYAIEVSEWTR